MLAVNLVIYTLCCAYPSWFIASSVHLTLCSRYQMGFDYGFMLADEIAYVYEALVHSLLPSPLEEPVIKLLEEEMDYQVWGGICNVCDDIRTFVHATNTVPYAM